MAQTYFASIQPGLEEALLSEIRSLGGKRARKLFGGVEFDAARKTLYSAHLRLRTPTRIWLRLDEFRARDAPELYRKSRRVQWERLLDDQHQIFIRAYSNRSSLYHTDKIAEALLGAIRDRFRDDLRQAPPEIVESPEENTQLLLVRIEEDRCQLSLDASGDLLHRRGWRSEAGAAPLRENLAAAMLKLVDWQPERGLFDPFCGSATLPVEAAEIALGLPAGRFRDFAFQRWKNFEPKRFQELREALLQSSCAATLPAPIRGSDVDPEVVERARRNAARAEVSGVITLETRSVEEAVIPERISFIATNPPYGARLDKDDALTKLLALWRQQKGCALLFLWPRDSRDQVARKAPTLEIAASFENGGLPVDLWYGG